MTTIVKPVWSVDGWIGNAVDPDGVRWFVRHDQGWFQPVGVRSSDIDRPTRNGTYSGGNLRTGRVITLSGFVEAPTTELADQAHDLFNALLADGGLHQLVVEENHRTLTAMVKLADGTNSERLTPRRSDWQLVLVAPDPRKLSPTANSATVGLTSGAVDGVQWNGPAGSTGVQWNGPAGTTGVEWGAAGTSNVATLDNTLSTAESDILFTITGPVTNPSIQNMETGQVLTYVGTLLVDEAVTIDTGSGVVLFQGVNRGPALSPAQFFTLPPRSSTRIAFTATSGSGQLTASWSDSYM